MLNSAGAPRVLRREHGLQLPLHPLQVTGWLALASLSAGAYLVLLPALPLHLQPAALATLSTLLLLHLAAHLATALIDPAEATLRTTAPTPIPSLDRTKHAHVIEQGLCHLCKVLVSPRTKHCSACNKCVARFDHHCKWLNHCVGERNYAPFLMCVTSAVAAATFVAIIAIAELILHQTDPSWLQRVATPPIHNSTSTSLPTSDATFIAIVTILALLAIIIAGLLIHLCFFHIYISCLGLTTYEYIRQQRLVQATPHTQPPITQPTTHCSPSAFLRRHRPANLRCEQPSRMTLFAVIEETFTCTPTPPSTPQDCQMCVVVNNSIAPQNGVQANNNRKFKQKWNCCVAVPDSPDQDESTCLMSSLCKHTNNKSASVPSITDASRRGTHGHWSSAKLRVLFKVLGNLGNSRRRRNSRNNQVTPANNETKQQPEHVQTISNLVPVEVGVPPPPPAKRRTISETELADALSCLQQQRLHASQRRTAPQYRRRRRSAAVHRTKTPALSPIRESGLSNPASPSRQTVTPSTTLVQS